MDPSDDPATAHELPRPAAEPRGCPWWCTREHTDSDHPEDRFHQGDPRVVPVLAGDAARVPVTETLRATNLVVRVGRHLADPLPWLIVEAEEGPGPRLLLSAESARAVALAMLDRLDDIDPCARTHDAPGTAGAPGAS